MDDFTKKDKYSSIHSAIKEVVSQNNDLYQKALEKKYGIKREEVTEKSTLINESYRNKFKPPRNEVSLKSYFQEAKYGSTPVFITFNKENETFNVHVGLLHHQGKWTSPSKKAKSIEEAKKIATEYINSEYKKYEKVQEKEIRSFKPQFKTEKIHKQFTSKRFGSFVPVIITYDPTADESELYKIYLNLPFYKGWSIPTDPVADARHARRVAEMEVEYSLRDNTNTLMESVQYLDEATVSFPIDLEKVKRNAPVKGMKSLRNNMERALDSKFKSKLGDYELVTDQKKNSTIVDVEIKTKNRLSKKDKTDIENHLVDKNLKIF